MYLGQGQGAFCPVLCRRCMYVRHFDGSFPDLTAANSSLTDLALMDVIGDLERAFNTPPFK